MSEMVKVVAVSGRIEEVAGGPNIMYIKIAAIMITITTPTSKRVEIGEEGHMFESRKESKTLSFSYMYKKQFVGFPQHGRVCPILYQRKDPRVEI